MKPRFAVAQIGARRHYAIPTILHRAGMLDRFYTDLSAEAWWLKLAERFLPSSSIPSSVKRLLARKLPAVPRHKIAHFARFGISRIMRRQRTTTAGKLAQQTLAANKEFCSLVQQQNFTTANAVYLFNAAALELLEIATERGMFRILEQTSAPIAFDERLLAEERQRWPGWEQGDIQSSDWQPMADRERDEWNLADAIFCGSDYVARTVGLEGGPVDRCVVVPYGVDRKVYFSPPRARHDRPLQLLAVGNISLRKGFQYLIEAAERLRSHNVTIRVVGQVMVSKTAERELRRNLELTGAVPRDRMREHYRWADAMVLPSLSEGSANACYEALASGLPVITTDHAGSVVGHGKDGFIIPIRSSIAIVDAVRALDWNRSRLAEMSRSAVARADEFGWGSYGQRLIEAINTVYARRFADTAVELKKAA